MEDSDGEVVIVEVPKTKGAIPPVPPPQPWGKRGLWGEHVPLSPASYVTPEHVAAPMPVCGPKSVKSRAAEAAGNSKFFPPVAPSGPGFSLRNRKIRNLVLMYVQPPDAKQYKRLENPGAVSLESGSEGVSVVHALQGDCGRTKWILESALVRNVYFAAQSGERVTAMAPSVGFTFFVELDGPSLCTLWGTSAADQVVYEDATLSFDTDANGEAADDLARALVGAGQGKTKSLSSMELACMQKVCRPAASKAPGAQAPGGDSARVAAKGSLSYVVDGDTPVFVARPLRDEPAVPWITAGRPMLPRPPPPPPPPPPVPAKKPRRTVQPKISAFQAKRPRVVDDDSDDEYVPPALMERKRRTVAAAAAAAAASRKVTVVEPVDDDPIETSDDDVREVVAPEPRSQPRLQPITRNLAAATAAAAATTATAKAEAEKNGAKVLFTYPEGDEDAVDIQVRDLEKCRDNDVYINDSIVDFYLKYAKHQTFMEHGLE